MADQGRSFPVGEDRVLNHFSGLHEQCGATTANALGFVLSVAMKARFWKAEGTAQRAPPAPVSARRQLEAADGIAAPLVCRSPAAVEPTRGLCFFSISSQKQVTHWPSAYTDPFSLSALCQSMATLCLESILEDIVTLPIGDVVLLYLPCLTSSSGLTEQQKTCSEGARGATQTAGFPGERDNSPGGLLAAESRGEGAHLLTAAGCFFLVVQTMSTLHKVSLPVPVWGCSVGFSAAWVSAWLPGASPGHRCVPLPSPPCRAPRSLPGRVGWAAGALFT